MDGNGRWASRRGLPRMVGHRRGAEAVRTTVRAAHDFGVRALTLFAFSEDNWRRPPTETGALMRLFTRYLRTERDKMVANGIRFEVIGRRDRLPAALRNAVGEVENATRTARTLHFRLAIDYSARRAIRNAAIIPDVDLLIRTGGERRLSNFLLWECAYAELYFTPVMWPDFAAADLAAAIDDFTSRERRFGGLPAAASAAGA